MTMAPQATYVPPPRTDHTEEGLDAPSLVDLMAAIKEIHSKIDSSLRTYPGVSRSLKPEDQGERGRRHYPYPNKRQKNSPNSNERPMSHNVTTGRQTGTLLKPLEKEQHSYYRSSQKTEGPAADLFVKDLILKQMKPKGLSNYFSIEHPTETRGTPAPDKSTGFQLLRP
ncbi:hypothetical protein NDU88_004778 [Pleurodeles waltl]|uniref:Uncharacterized protein n=1 Tax=Pleurodeles waltl TaxID=8319 RepID=A0AAV7UG56_PLEWA|nr:hypothetical protein NDU88_004778 [Pleurodeles waltl]